MQYRCEVCRMHVYLSVWTGMWVFDYININNVFPLLSHTQTHTLHLSSLMAYRYESEDKKA